MLQMMWLGLGRYRCGARYPILSAPNDADTDTGCDVKALCGLTDELSKIFFPCKGLWSSNSVLRQNNKTVHQQRRAKHPSVKATVYCRSMFTQ
jgi:hypothetical protein